MTNSASRTEALEWLAGRVKWERLLDELRDITTAEPTTTLESHRTAPDADERAA